MTMTTLSSREFNQDAGGARKAAKDGPVFITERGRPTHVLLTIGEYRKLMRRRPSIVDMLAMPGSEAIAFEPPRLSGELHRPAEFT